MGWMSIPALSEGCPRREDADPGGSAYIRRSASVPMPSRGRRRNDGANTPNRICAQCVPMSGIRLDCPWRRVLNDSLEETVPQRRSVSCK